MSAEDFNRSQIDALGHQAAQWLARRDRGLTAVEQDGYLQWLREDPRHAAAIARHEATLRRMMQLKNWQPAQSSEPNPDLFAPPRIWRRRLVPAILAAAAVLVVGFVAWRHFSTPVSGDGPPTSHLIVNERESLPDGSVVEIADGSRIAVEYTAEERRVRLIGKEAHFTVAKNRSWPFVVEAGGVLVHAVGTVFDVRLEAASVEVLVTEGKVCLQHATGAGRPLPASESPIISAGYRAIVSRSSIAQPPKISLVSAEKIKEALAWQSPRLQFRETPLIDAVAEFNQHNRLQLVIGDPRLNSIPIGGTFRVDNVEGFARLLEVTLSVRAERRNAGEIVLTRTK